MPYSRAILRTSGDSAPPGNSALDLLRDRLRSRSSGSSRCRRLLDWARGAAEPVRPLAGAGGARGGGGGGGAGLAATGAGAAAPLPPRFVDSSHDGADRHRLAFFHQNFLQDSGGGRWNLGVHFVGRDLEQRLVALHVLARLLQPLGQGAFHDTLAHLGHHYVSHENVSVNEGTANIVQLKMFREISRQRRHHLLRGRPPRPARASK